MVHIRKLKTCLYSALCVVEDFRAHLFNPIKPIVALYIETSYLFCVAKQMNGFYMEHNTGPK